MPISSHTPEDRDNATYSCPEAVLFAVGPGRLPPGRTTISPGKVHLRRDKQPIFPSDSCFLGQGQCRRYHLAVLGPAEVKVAYELEKMGLD